MELMMMPPKTRELIRSFIADLDIGEEFSIEDIRDWFKATWPRYTPSSNGIGCYMRGYGNVQIIKTGVYKVIA